MASTVYQFPQIFDNGFPPRAGIGSRLPSTQSPHPGHSPPPGKPPTGRSQFSPASGPGCPSGGYHAAAGGRALPRPSPCAPSAAQQGVPSRPTPVTSSSAIFRGCQFFILRPLRRYARSCCATAPPSPRLGAAPLRRAALFLLERPPALGGAPVTRESNRGRA